MHQQLPVHRAIMVVDVERFGDPARTNLDQLAIRAALYKALAGAFGQSGISWGSCACEDRGDGALILIPPEVPKTRLVTSVPGRLATAVSRHDAECGVHERMRLRVALHAGEVYRDAHGVAGAAVNHTFRLAEAPPVREALDASPVVLALIVSDWLFTEVVRHDPAAEPGSYRRVNVIVKETAATGWLRVLDPDPAEQDNDLHTEYEAEDRLRVIGRHAPRGLVSGDLLDMPERRGVTADSAAGPRRPVPAQLPHDILGFTGREPELAVLESLAAGQESAAVVISAIDGVAGIGKTALAVHFAHRVGAAFPDGQLFANLRGFDPDQPPLTPGDVLAGFLRALGADPSQLPADLDELAAMYRSVLSGRRVLVVLDNASSAGQVRPLLPGTAGCLAVVTSRNRLSGLAARDGAQRLTLDVLPPGEAIALIIQGAGDERASADPDATRKLARLCGWLPLALRITADRAAACRHLTMADLVDELTLESDRLDALAADEKTTQVRAVLSWSYRALSPAQARAFRLIGLHPGRDISTWAAVALIDAPVPQVRHLLSGLTGGHLLEETGRDRYQFHDLVRVYAAECAQASETEPDRAAAIRRLLTWYLHTSDEFFRTFNPDSLQIPLEPPRPACKPLAFTAYRQALDWAKSEITNLVAAARVAATTGDDDITWKLPIALLPVFSIQRRTADLLPALRSALSVTEQHNDRTAEAWILRCLAEACLDIGHPAWVAGFTQRAQVISAADGDAYGQWGARFLEGISYLALGRFDAARDHLGQALTAARQAGSLRAEGLSLVRLGEAHQCMGLLEIAISLHQDGLAILSQTHNRWQYALAIRRLADAHRDQGRANDAAEQYQQALTILREVGDHWAEAEILVDLGHVQKTQGRPDACRQSWQMALIIFKEFGDARADQLRQQLNELAIRQTK